MVFAVSAYFFFNFGLKPHHFTCLAPVLLLALPEVIAGPLAFSCQRGGRGNLQLVRLMKAHSFLLSYLSGFGARGSILLQSTPFWKLNGNREAVAGCQFSCIKLDLILDLLI